MFSPLLLAAVGSIVKRLLTMLAGYLIGAGFWTAAEGGTYVEALAGVLTVTGLTAVYQVYDKYLKPKVMAFLAKED